MMRVALIVNSFPKLSETFIVNKVLGLRNAGVDVTVWVHSPECDANAFQDRLGNSQIPYVREVLLSRGALLGVLRTAWLMMQNPFLAFRLWSKTVGLYSTNFRALRAWVMAFPLVSEHYDLIHFEMSGLAVVYVDVLSLLSPAKLVTSCRGTAEKITALIDPSRASLLKIVFSRMDAVHCVSHDMQRTVEKYGLQTDKALVNHPAIDAALFCRRSPYVQKLKGPYCLATVGRLQWLKGIEFALLAVRILKDQGDDIVFHILGAGDEDEKIRYLVNYLDLKDVVVLHGGQPATVVRELLEKVDIFLLPSLSEGLNNAALEAMAMEIPVVSTSVGGMPEVITDGVDGFLIPPMHPELMAEKVKLLLMDIQLRMQIGRAARLRVEKNFNIKKQVEIFLNKYKELIGGCKIYSGN